MSIITEKQANGTGSFLQDFFDQKRWVAWKYGKVKDDGKREKVPRNVVADRACTGFEPENWFTRVTVDEYVQNHISTGVGFGLDGNGLTCIDLDHAWNHEKNDWHDWAWEWVRALNAPTEISVSGEGLHIWVYCDDELKVGIDGGQIFQGKRYIAITEKMLSGYEMTDIPNRTAELRALLGRPTSAGDEFDSRVFPELCRTKNPKFQHLWEGDWQRHDFPSQSEADLALMNMLATRTSDRETLRDWFGRSELANRDKWQKNLGNYQDRTIQRSLESVGLEIDWNSTKRSRSMSEVKSFKPKSSWEVGVENTNWLIENWIPAGEVMELTGDPSVGKSTLSATIAAHISLGTPLLGDIRRREPAGVLIITAEDSSRKTTNPRVIAAGADRSKVFIYDRAEIQLPDDIPLVRDFIIEKGIKLVIIDPITGYLPDKVDTRIDASTRKMMTPLSEMAHDLDVTIMLIRHLNKNTKETNSKYRAGGSIAFTAVARVGLMAFDGGRDEESGEKLPRVLTVHKSNLGPVPKSWLYSVEERVIEGEKPGTLVKTSGAVWLQESDTNADDLLMAAQTNSGRQNNSLGKYNELLRRLFAAAPDGRVPVADVKQACEDEGLSWSTLNKHDNRVKLNVGFTRDGRASYWHWATQIVVPDQE